MKSEERHRLQANELERWIEKIGHSSATFLEAHGLKLLIAAGVAVVALGGAVYWYRSESRAEAEGWTEIIVAESAEQYANVAEKYAESEVGAWARLNEANEHLAQGINQMFSTVSGGRDELALAQQAYEDVLALDSLPQPARERAMYGLAQSLEARSASDTSEAVAAYEALLEEFPESIFKATVQERIRTLERKDTQDFYAWFQSAPRQQASDRDQPFDFNPQRPPQTDASEIPVLPEIPDLLKLPDVSDDEGDTQPRGTAPAFPELPPDSNGTADPAPSDTPSDASPADKPETDKPEADQPAADKPDEGAPADPQPTPPSGDSPAASDTPASADTPPKSADTPDAPGETPDAPEKSPESSSGKAPDASPPDSPDPS